MAKRAARGPQIEPVNLVGLTEDDGATLRAGDSLDGLRYDRTDLGGRDLTGAGFLECEFQSVSFDDATLRGVTLSECVLLDVNAAVFTAPRSGWRDVRVERSRLGSVEVYEAAMRSVRFDGCKLGFVNLRNSQLSDVLISNCIIEELDLGSATVQRLELRNCRVGTLDVANARLTDVDLRSSDFSAIHGIDGLRGAIIDDSQLSLLAPILATHLGIVVD